MIKKNITLLLLVPLLFVFSHVHAQTIPTASTTETISTTSAVPESTSAVSQSSAVLSSSHATTTTIIAIPVSLDIQGSQTDVQNSSSTQEAVTGLVLEQTANPEASSSEQTQIPIEATTSDAAIPVVVDDTQKTESISIESNEATVIAQDIEASPMPEGTQTLSIKNLEPDFTFALTGKEISAKRKVIDTGGKVIREEVVSQALTSSVDNAKGEVAVSGICSNENFVVLLFKGAGDYLNDPRSAIVNRAYPCTGGQFSYAMSDLPATLPNGTYYLMVGEEAKSGAWEPITKLTEITITNNN